MAELGREQRARLVERERFERKFSAQEDRLRAMESKIAETMAMAEQVWACQFMRDEGDVENHAFNSEEDAEVCPLWQL
jgi:hypothetical protein